MKRRLAKESGFINVDGIMFVKQKYQGLYVVPGKVICQPNHFLPGTYVAALRYQNLRGEIITSVQLILEYLKVAPSDIKGGSNQMVRQSLRTLIEMNVCHSPSYGFKPGSPTRNRAFIMTFNQGYGWRHRPYDSSGYVKDSELNKLREKGQKAAVGQVTRMPFALHILLFIRMKMEKPALATTMKALEKDAMAIISEDDFREHIGVLPGHLLRAMKHLKNLNILDFRRREVREKPNGRPITVYIIVNKTTCSTSALQRGLNSLNAIFPEVTFMSDNLLRTPLESVKEDSD